MPGPRSFRSQHGGILLWLLVLLLLALVLGTLYLLRGPILLALGNWWVVDDDLDKAQAVVVLGGDSVLGDRVRHAADLYRRGWAPRVVLSGPPLRSYFSEAELMEREALQRGVARKDLIVVQHQAASTRDEALALRAELARRNLRKLIVVTSNFHTRRARRIFRAVFEPAGATVILSAAPDPDFRIADWWQNREARARLFLEFLKYVYTLWELRHLPPPPSAEEIRDVVPPESNTHGAPITGTDCPRQAFRFLFELHFRLAYCPAGSGKARLFSQVAEPTCARKKVLLTRYPWEAQLGS